MIKYRSLFLALLILGCSKKTLSPNDILIDTIPPTVNIISPSQNSVISENSLILIEAIDDNEVKFVEILIDSMHLNLIDSIPPYEISFNTTTYNDGAQFKIFAIAQDKSANIGYSSEITVLIDNSNSYPASVTLLSLDSLSTGFNLKWSESNEADFAYYKLQISEDPLMINNAEIFNTNKIYDTEFIDNSVKQDHYYYYRVIIGDLYGFESPSNILSTSMNDMPIAPEILSVKYTLDSLEIFWNDLTISDYLFHKLLFSNSKNGVNDTLADFNDMEINNFISFDYSPMEENWFSILVSDNLGQLSISEAYQHPYPNEPNLNFIEYSANEFIINWTSETDNDFFSYKVLESKTEDINNLLLIEEIFDQFNSNVIIQNVQEKEYFLYQIIVSDIWGLQTYGDLWLASSFYKFSVTVGDIYNDQLNSVLSLSDGSYISIGESFYNSTNCGLIVKIDPLGNKVWEHRLENGTSSGFNDIKRNYNNDGYIITGYSYASGQDEDIWLLKVNLFGEIIWSSFFGGDQNDASNAIEILEDGNIVMTGYYHTEPDNKDMFITKTNNDGEEIWTKYFGDVEHDEGLDVINNNGNILVCALTHSEGINNGEIWTVELTPNGEILNSKIFYKDGYQKGYSISHGIDNGYIILGTNESTLNNSNNSILMKINSDFEVEWEQEIGGHSNDILSSIKSLENNYIAVGQTYSFGSGQGDVWLVSISYTGEILWYKTIGGENNDKGQDISIANDTGFIICGSTYSFGSGQRDGWIIKTDSRGNFE